MNHQNVSVPKVIEFLHQLQNQICVELEQVDGGAKFHEDQWNHENGGGGRSRVLESGLVFEKAGVNFSHVRGQKLPVSASANRPGIAGKPFEATGVSLVVHPNNPFVPTVHMNVRLFVADPESDSPVWWFGGGFDLTPYYGFDEDCRHWHSVASQSCLVDGAHYYPRFKQWCDEYFYIKHRNEPRGIGGVFFDDFNVKSFSHGFKLIQSIGEGFIDGYIPIVLKRRQTSWNQQHKDFQQYRRGRYVEFNLVYDRGTIFGLQSGGRIESILMSMPPQVSWRYNWSPKPGSEEEKLYQYYLQPKDWLA